MLILIGYSSVFGQAKQTSASPYINLSKDHFTIGPVNGDTTSFVVTSNLNWKVINSLGWIKTNPAWITITGDYKVIVTLDTQWFTQEDLTGVDLQGTFTIEEDSQLTSRIIKTITVTLKSFPAILTVPTHTVSFAGIESHTVTLVSNLGWNTVKNPNSNWLKVTPSYANSGTTDLKLDCIATNPGSKDNSLYLIINQTKGTLKDSILLIQTGSHVGVKYYDPSGFKIYPQPAKETLNIELPVNNMFKNWNIYSLIGKELMKGTMENKDKLQIHVSGLGSGLYLIVLRSDSEKIGLKFTK